MDTNDGVFLPAMCDIQSQESKASLVVDIVQGFARLKEQDLRYTVTGPVLEECYFLPWAAPNGSADAISLSPANPEGTYPLSSTLTSASASTSNLAATPSSPAT